MPGPASGSTRSSRGTERYGCIRCGRARRRHRWRARRHRGCPRRQDGGARRGGADRRRIRLPCLPAVELAAAVRDPRRALGRRGRPADRGDRRPGRLGPGAAAAPRGRAGDPRHRPDHRRGHGRGGARPGGTRRGRPSRKRQERGQGRDNYHAYLLGPGHRDRLRAGRASDRGPVRHPGLDHRAEPELARPAPAPDRARRRPGRVRADAGLRLVRLTGDAGGGGTQAAPG